MKLQKRSIIFIFVVLFAVAAYFAALYGMDQYREHLEDSRYAEKISAIHAHSTKPDGESFHETADRLHDFVRDNSQHLMDTEFYANWPDRMKLADAFIAGLDGKRKDKPHMECSTRSDLLGDLHMKEGHRVRDVVMYSPAQNLINHRVIEVLNPETKRWEAYDVTYDLFYRNKETGERVSTAEAAENIELHEPCNTKNRCGWDLVSHDKQQAIWLSDYLRIISIYDKKTGSNFSLHAKDVAPDHVYNTSEKTSGTYCELFKMSCKSGFLPFEKGMAKSREY